MTNIVLNVIVLAVLGAVSLPGAAQHARVPAAVDGAAPVRAHRGVRHDHDRRRTSTCIDPDKILGVYVWGAPAGGLRVRDRRRRRDARAVDGARSRWATPPARGHARRPRVREVLAASRPFSWINTAYPFAAGYLLATGGRIDATFVVGTLFFLGPVQPADVRRSTTSSTTPPTCATRARAGSRAVSWTRRARARCTAGSCGRASSRPCRSSSTCWPSGTPPPNATLALVLFLVVAYSAPVLRFKERPVLDSADVRDALRRAAALRARAGGRAT